MAVVLMDNGAMANDYYYRRAAIPYRSRSVQPVSNSINSIPTNSYYNPYNQYKISYNPYANRWAKPIQYKWKLDFDDSIEDLSDSHESSEVYRYPTYHRRF